MSSCRYDRDANEYLIDGEPCRRDEHGDRTYHCTARRTCSQHIGRGELTCARCIGRVRQDIRAVAELATLMPVEALAGGVDSEAAMLAGPAADVEAWSWRKIAAKQGGAWHLSLDEEDDDWHPQTVMTRWQWMVSEDYGDGRRGDLAGAAAYLDRHLHKIAQDESQDFGLLRREMRACRAHLETVLHNSSRLERGAPCPDCRADGHFVRLQHEFGHWCLDPECCREHYATAEGDRWVCPRNRQHIWSEAAYRAYIEDRTA